MGAAYHGQDLLLEFRREDGEELEEAEEVGLDGRAVRRLALCSPKGAFGFGGLRRATHGGDQAEEGRLLLCACHRCSWCAGWTASSVLAAVQECGVTL